MKRMIGCLIEELVDWIKIFGRLNAIYVTIRCYFTLSLQHLSDELQHVDVVAVIYDDDE
jgi:hypothetical protein